MRKALEVRSISVQEMASYLEVSRVTVSRWINGKQAPSKQTMRLWAMRTGVPLFWLETGEAPSPSGDGASNAPRTGLEPVTLWGDVLPSQLTVRQRVSHPSTQRVA